MQFCGEHTLTEIKYYGIPQFRLKTQMKPLFQPAQKAIPGFVETPVDNAVKNLGEIHRFCVFGDN
jgi:hypothetical protein